MQLRPAIKKTIVHETMRCSAAGDVSPALKIVLKDKPSGEIVVSIKTDRLIMRSVTSTANTLRRCRQVFGDADVMKHYGKGKARDLASCRKRLAKWTALWEAGDPFSGLAITRLKSPHFVGFIRLSKTGLPGVVELTYALAKDSWGCGFASEAAAAIVAGYMPMLRKRRYCVANRLLSEVVSTVHPDNIASAKVVKKCGMKATGNTINRYGDARFLFGLSLDAAYNPRSKINREAKRKDKSQNYGTG